MPASLYAAPATRASFGRASLLSWGAALVALVCGCTDSTPQGTRGGHAGAGGLGAAGQSGGADLELVGLRKAAADAGKLIGTAVDADALRSDPEYAEILAREFDSITPENATKWGPLAPNAASYAWADADAIVDFAEEHSQAVKGHALVWHRQNPSWVNSSMTAAELSAALKNHIETTLEHFGGRVRAWDVVNEAVDTNTASGYTESIFWEKLGPSYIEDAFRWARAADPEVVLVYNEVGIERIGAKSDFTYELMRDLLERGTPIDEIGFQSHVSTHRYPPESNLRANIRRFADLGLRVNISEVDARTLLMPGDRQTRWDIQRLAFQQIVGACVVEPGCEGITLWGFTDRYSWINDGAEADEPLIYDRDYNPKPAYSGVLAGLAGQLPIRGENLVEDAAFDSGADAWSVTGGELSVADAEEREGIAACVSARLAEGDGLSQDLLEPLSAGGALSVSAWVRLRGTDSATVDAVLLVQEGDSAPEERNIATVTARDSEWIELAGYFGVGFEVAPTTIQLQIHGPPAAVDLCIADVRVEPLALP